MSPSQMAVYTDEDVAKAVAEALKRRGFKASTTSEHKNMENRLEYLSNW